MNECCIRYRRRRQICGENGKSLIRSLARRLQGVRPRSVGAAEVSEWEIRSRSSAQHGGGPRVRHRVPWRAQNQTAPTAECSPSREVTEWTPCQRRTTHVEEVAGRPWAAVPEGCRWVDRPAGPAILVDVYSIIPTASRHTSWHGSRWRKPAFRRTPTNSSWR